MSMNELQKTAKTNQILLNALNAFKKFKGNKKPTYN